VCVAREEKGRQRERGFVSAEEGVVLGGDKVRKGWTAQVAGERGKKCKKNTRHVRSLKKNHQKRTP